MSVLKSLTVLLLLTAVTTGVPAESEFCAVDGPASVLACLEKAYAERDLEQWDALFAPEYRFFFGPGGTSLGRTEEMESAAKMFTDPGVRKLTVKVEGDYTVTKGPEPDTWVLDGMKSTISIEMEEQQLQAAIESMRLLVREVPEPEPHFVIVEWHDTRE